MRIMSTLNPQQLQALNLNNHTIVTANAGSGKTFILTRRFIETILNKRIGFKEIVAITFTEKAASELLKKISDAIDEKLNSLIRSEEFFYLKKFREYILSTKISTIHSFCFDILKEFPIEAGIDPSFNIIDDLTKKELIEKSIVDTLIANIQEEKVKDFLRMFDKEKTSELLSRLIEKRYFTDKLINELYTQTQDEAKKFKIYYDKILQRAKEYFLDNNLSHLENALNLFSGIKNEITVKSNREKVIQEIKQIEDELSLLIKDFDFEKFKSLLSLITKTLLTDKFEVRKREFKYFTENSCISQFQQIFYQFKDLKDCDFSINSEEKKFRYIETLIQLYQQAKEKFQEFKLTEGVLDFDDLLILTDKLLDNEIVQKELSERYKFILVDEFQDTDSIQFSILSKLTNNFDKEHNIFVVGDEKQSIYGFRNAQLKVFQDFKLQLKKKKEFESSIVTLSASYRSTPSIAAFVNLIFNKLFIHQSEEKKNYHQSVEYSPLFIGREKYLDDPINFIVSCDTENQYEKIADYILYLVNSEEKVYDQKRDESRKIEFGDIALLFRTRDEIKEFEYTFIKKNIPFIVSGGRGFYQAEEIQDWLKYLSFLANPDDDIALISILRSPFFVLSDEEILKINFFINYETNFFQNGHNSFFKKMKLYSHANSDDERIKQIVNTLEIHLRQASRYSIPELIQTILSDTDYFGKIQYHPKKTQIIANIEKLINVAHNFELTGLEDLATFADYLKLAYTEMESAEATISEIKGSVNLMTIHQAKGLEFPVVILPNLEKAMKSSNISFGEISINDDFGFIFKMRDEDQISYHTLSSFFGNKINYSIDYNEELRLLYVALTRATDKLILSFTHSTNQNGTQKSNKKNDLSYKSLILQSLNISDLTNNRRIQFSTKLHFLKLQNNSYTEEINDHILNIDVIRDIEVSTSQQLLKPEIQKIEKKYTIFTDSLSDSVKEEIFTATQLKVYQFCPVKYILKFIIGYNPLKDYYSEKSIDEEISGAEVGNIFHELMRRINSTELDDAISELDSLLENYPESINKNIKNNLLPVLRKLFAREDFLEIIKCEKSYKEFEIKLKFHGHILFGIIDRINIYENGITIIDYKTDKFDQKYLQLKVDEYLKQMEPYVLLVSEFFEVRNNIELIIYFVNHPEWSYKKIFKISEVDSIRKNILDIITQISSNKFNKNEANCSFCEYAMNNLCILSTSSSEV